MIVMENVCKSYPKSGGRGAIRVLDGVSFHIHPREYAAFIGPSGSGKSTLLNVMGCLDSPTSGRYRLDGVEVSALPFRELCALRREKIGFVFQGFQLLQKLTAWENVAFPLLLKGVEEPRRREAAMETLRRVGMADRAEHRPCQLSGGQQQRVAIARAMATRCCCPPLSWQGRCSARSAMPTLRRVSMAASRRRGSSTPFRSRGKATFSQAVSFCRS